MKIVDTLLVDDESHISKHYLKSLSDVGLTIKYCKSPKSASTWIKKNRARIYVLDLMMPSRGFYSEDETLNDMFTGLVLAKNIRLIDETGHVVILTNLNMSIYQKRLVNEIKDLNNVYLRYKNDSPPNRFAEAISALLNDKMPLESRKNVLRHFFDSLIFQPNFFGFGLDLKKLLGLEK